MKIKVALSMLNVAPSFVTMKLVTAAMFLIGLHGNVPCQSSAEVICAGTIEKPSDTEDPILVRSCSIDPYIFMSTGYPDAKGRYSWSHEIHIAQREKPRPLLNREAFVDDAYFMQQLNQRFEQKLKELRSDTANVECFMGREEELPIRTIDDISVSLEQNGFWFHLNLSMPSACFNVNTLSVLYPIEEVHPFLREQH